MSFILGQVSKSANTSNGAGGNKPLAYQEMRYYCTNRHSIVYQLDEQGEEVLDEEGNKVPVLGEDEKPLKEFSKVHEEFGIAKPLMKKYGIDGENGVIYFTDANGTVYLGVVPTDVANSLKGSKSKDNKTNYFKSDKLRSYLTENGLLPKFTISETEGVKETVDVEFKLEEIEDSEMVAAIGNALASSKDSTVTEASQLKFCFTLRLWTEDDAANAKANGQEAEEVSEEGASDVEEDGEDFV